MFCFTHKLVPSLVVIREVSSRSWEKQMLIPKVKNQTKGENIGWRPPLGSFFGAQKTLWMRSRMNYGSQSGQGHWENMGHGLCRADGGSQSPNWQSGGIHGSEIGSLHIWLLAWFFEETFDNESRDVSDSFACPWDPSPPNRLSHLVLFRFVSPFIVPFPVDDPGRPALFCGETGEKWIS